MLYRNKFKLLLLVLLVLTTLLGPIDHTWSVTFCLLLLVSLALYALLRIRQRIGIFLLCITLFVFLLYRPVMGILYSIDWISATFTYGASRESVFLALHLISVSILGLFLGYLVGESLGARSEVGSNNSKLNHNHIISLQYVGLAMLLVSMVCMVMKGIELYIFSRQFGYVAYYSVFKSKLPYCIEVFARFIPCLLPLFFSTLPKKKVVILISLLYVLGTIPFLMTGFRSYTVLAILFCVSYFLIRDEIDGHGSFLGKKELLLISIGGLFSLVIVAFIRDSGNFSNFFYHQGVSFAWLAAGLNHVSELVSDEVKSYTIGTILDYWSHGKLAQVFLGAEPLSGFNSVEMARFSQSMAHHLSYVLLGDRYLEGRGTGSCYLLETFVDFGVWGVTIFSLLIGAFLGGISRVAIKSKFALFVLLTSFQGIIYMPRAAAVSGFEMFTQISFWIPLVICCFFAYLTSVLKK